MVCQVIKDQITFPRVSFEKNLQIIATVAIPKQELGQTICLERLAAHIHALFELKCLKRISIDPARLWKLNQYPCEKTDPWLPFTCLLSVQESSWFVAANLCALPASTTAFTASPSTDWQGCVKHFDPKFVAHTEVSATE